MPVECGASVGTPDVLPDEYHNFSCSLWGSLLICTHVVPRVVCVGSADLL
jgi:hypothetical protein